jgi:hypothetical protein
MIFDNIPPHRQTPQVMARVKAAQRACQVVGYRVHRPQSRPMRGYGGILPACFRESRLATAVLRRLRWPA